MLQSKLRLLLLLIGFSVLFQGCDLRSRRQEMRKDWTQIKAAGKLTLLTENTTLSFFEFKGKRMGFEYEILDTFCKANHLKLEVKVLNKLSDFGRLLRKGEGDVVAANLPIALRQEKYFQYSCRQFFQPVRIIFFG